MAFASDKEALDALRGKHAELTAEIRKVIVGQEEVVEQVLVSVFSGGHCLLVGVPGLAKTLLVNTIAQALGLSFNRIQFTPDLMPSDIIGSEILDEQRRFQFNKGPLFANINGAWDAASWRSRQTHTSRQRSMTRLMKYESCDRREGLRRRT